MKNKKIFLWGLMLLLALSIVLVACSSDSDEGTDTGTTKEPSTETTAPEETTSTPQVLVFGRGADSVSLDPGIVTEGESFKVTQNLFETLLNFGQQDTTINPGLAKEWNVSDDGLTYTFILEEGVKFHDGTDFNAEAVVKNVNRWKGGTAEDFYYFNSMFKAEGEDVIAEVVADGDHKVVFHIISSTSAILKKYCDEPVRYCVANSI